MSGIRLTAAEWNQILNDPCPECGAPAMRLNPACGVCREIMAANAQDEAEGVLNDAALEEIVAASLRGPSEIDQSRSN